MLILQLMENSATQQASKTHLALEILASRQLHMKPSSEDSDLVPSLAVGGDGISSLQDQASCKEDPEDASDAPQDQD